MLVDSIMIVNTTVHVGAISSYYYTTFVVIPSSGHQEFLSSSISVNTSSQPSVASGAAEGDRPTTTCTSMSRQINCVSPTSSRWSPICVPRIIRISNMMLIKEKVVLKRVAFVENNVHGCDR